MGRRLLKKIRNFRVLTGILVMLLTVMSFQNCAPQNMCGTSSSSSSSSTDCSTSGSTSSASTSSGSSTTTTSSSSLWASRPAGTTSGGVSIGGSSGGSVSPGSTGGSSTSGGGAVVIGGGSTGGSSSGGSSGSTGGSIDTTFRIATQPQGTNVMEGARFQLEVIAAGGKAPFSYQWYKDGAAITNGLGVYSFYADEATSYTKQGTYHVVVKDASGQSIQSSLARVTIQEPAVGCNAGSYFTFTNAQYDTGFNYFAEYFDGPRGKFLLHQSYDTMNFLYQYRTYTKLSDYNVPNTLPYLGKTWISCRTTIPRIHTPQPNPSYSWDWGYANQYADNGAWTYEGSVTFECHNKKLKLIENTCKWVNHPEYNIGN